jgi:SAM-dependent methyltransferase
MEIINPGRFDELVRDAQEAVFSGWDFSWLDNRMIQEDTPWDYPALVKEQFDTVQSLLDMGTGGGEILASLAPLPPDTHATEAYPPNQQIARERLAPLGVEVHDIEDSDPLPFPDSRFDMVINRHESFDSQELYRVLKPGGIFITQQVGGLDNLELNQYFEKAFSAPFMDWGLAPTLTSLYENGLDVVRAEKATLKTTFKDIGAVVYYLKVITWQVVGFTPEAFHERLAELNNIIERQGEFISFAHRFLVIARRKA